MIFAGNEGDLKSSSGNLLVDEMKIEFSVLSASMKDGIGCEVGHTEVAIVKSGSRGKGKMKLAKKRLKP